MVTPLATPTSLGKKFPLFNSLLKEGRCKDSNLVPQRCPATAPVLGIAHTRTYTLPQAQSGDTAMSEEMTSGSHGGSQNPATEIPGREQEPITLQDPPKSKLKRQLSIDTAEKFETQRVRKKQIVEEKHGGINLISDEVDGGPSTSGVEIQTGQRENPLSRLHDPLAERRPVTTMPIGMSPGHRQFSAEAAIPTIYGPEGLPLSSSDSKQSGNVLYQTGSAQLRPETVNYQTPIQSSCDSRKYHYREQTEQGLLSPGHFNLSEICQTSPFISTTPKVHKKQDSNVFIFPDQSTPKKVSPYAASTEQPPGSLLMSHASPPKRQTQRPYPRQDRELPEGFVADRRQLTRSEDGDIPGIQYPPYVSPKGFHWPTVATISQAPPISPRITTSDVRSHYPITHETSSRSTSRYEGSEEDYARLCMLRREYSRAMKTYGYQLREPEVCRPREINDVIRGDRFKTQRSAEEHSPNEKAIREIQEDVHSKYERSISDPLYSPNNYRQILRRASRFARERLPAFSDENEEDAMEKGEGRREAWQHDYRRRLFMKDDTCGTCHPERRRLPFDYDTHLVTGKTEIPTEVLDFLHSLNFHPEELENLKDYIRRGGSESPSFSRMTSGHLEGQDDHLRPPLPEAEFHRRSPNERLEADFRQRQFKPPQRERQLGDINVRLTCANIKEKGSQPTESESDVTDCKCARIENEIRAMAMDAYSKIRRLDEFNETNTNVFDSMRVLQNIKSLCNHGRTVEEIYTGSVVFTINCPDIDSLLDLWSLYKSGSLLKLMQEAFVTEELKKKHGCEEIELKVTISKEEYLTCKHELEMSFQKMFMQCSQKSASIIHARSRSEPASMSKQANNLTPQAKNTLSPFRERFCSDSSVELSPRRAFQEINTRDVPILPNSPSKKYFPDNVFCSEDPPRSPLAPISPQPSPRKKSFGTKLQFQEHQQENVEQNPDINPTTSGTPV